MGWLAAIASALHVLGLATGLPAIAWRARAMLAGDIVNAERADNLWGISALLFIGTGLWRLLGGLEKGAAFYMVHWAFHAKMGLVAVVLLLELWPMVALLAWRLRRKRDDSPPARLRLFGWFSVVETALLLIIPFLAAAMARALAPPF